ncbi:MAG: hypothetical protein P1U34_03090 [Coxiellaceae bacterium]|nr:hypothetical protein [Coxiellaceae bacterium]
MNKTIKRIAQITTIGACMSLLTACNIESSDMWSSDGFDSYTSSTVVESYDTAPRPRHHWHHHWRHGWEPAPRPQNHGHYGPPARPKANQGHYGPPTQKPKNQGHYGPSTASSSNSGHYGPKKSDSDNNENQGHYGPSSPHKMAGNMGHPGGPFSPVHHGLKQ